MPRGTLKTNFRAVALLRSWLRASNIPFSEGLMAPTDLVVGDPPNTIGVHVTLGPQDTTQGLEEPPGINLDGHVICFGKSDEATLEFWRLLQAIGIYNPLMPFYRGPEPKERVKSKTGGEELVYFRHDKFRKAPNPTHEQVLKYSNAVSTAVKSFWKKNQWVFKDLHIEFEEIMTYAWVWATIFMANYELPGENDTQNQKLMVTWLSQQFWEFRNRNVEKKVQALKKVRSKLINERLTGNCRAGREGGKVPLPNYDMNSHIVNSIDMMRDPLLLGQSRDYDVEVNRQRFEDLLKQLPHDEMVSRLEAAGRAKTALDRDARGLAMRHLRQHSRKCQTCRSKKKVTQAEA